MVNDENRRSHDLQDELRGKPEWVGAYASERFSFSYLGKASRDKPRPKPESGNPTFRDCRGARGNVTWSQRRGRAPRLYPDSLPPMFGLIERRPLPSQRTNPHAYASRLCLTAQRASAIASVFIGGSRQIGTSLIEVEVGGGGTSGKPCCTSRR
jgi:hypothetical protein